MKNRLVVGFDGSEASKSALRWAAETAETRDASVRVISSYAMPPVIDYYGVGAAVTAPADVGALRDACTAQLHDSVTAAVKAHPALGFDYRAESNNAVEALVGESSDADLVVLGSNGASPTRSFLLGSVNLEVLHLSVCPVAVVPEVMRAAVGRVTVAIDGSAASSGALIWAIDEADRRDATLVVAHAWQYPYESTAERFERGRDIAHVDAATVLEDAVRTARERRSGVVLDSLVEGSATDVLFDAADHTDLLVVGSRGRGGFRSMLLGSVAMSLAGRASCPVVVVR